MQKYLLHSTIIAVFSEAFLFRLSIDAKFMYFIVLINLILILSKTTLYMPKYWKYVIVYLLFTGILTIFLYGNQLTSVLAQIIGISIISLYFYNFLKYSKYPLEEIFKTYCKYAYIISIIGLIIFFVQLLTGFDINTKLSQAFPFYGYTPSLGEISPLKVKSILLEPAHFGAIVLPAFAYYLFSFKYYKKKVFVIATALILSFSSITYVGIILCLLLTQKKINFLKLGIVSFICILFGVIAYNAVPDLKLRFDDTFKVLSDDQYDFDGVNLSTYALLSNLYVTAEVFKSNPVIGHGIGSHPISHKEYISGISGTNSFEENGLSDINAQDANSFLLRVISEDGLIGVLLIFFFIKGNYSSMFHMISKPIIVYFIYKLIRDGHYFPPEMYFFVFIYYFLHKNEVFIKRNSLKSSLANNANISYNV